METTIVRERWHLSGALCVLLALSGCHASNGGAKTLPTTSPNSAALPGAVDAADAPNAPSVAETSNAQLIRYQDTAHGVSFAYPAAWRPPQVGVNAAPQPEFASVVKPLMTQQFLAAGTPYANTVLRSLSFSYAVKPHLSQAACAGIPSKALQVPGTGGPAIYGGVPYTEAGSTDGAMCHALKATVDTTLHGGSCFVFEQDENFTCPDLKADHQPRPLTPDEQSALDRHLKDIMQSVRIDEQP